LATIRPSCRSRFRRCTSTVSTILSANDDWNVACVPLLIVNCVDISDGWFLF
jgi:hypothetical protein